MKIKIDLSKHPIIDRLKNEALGRYGCPPEKEREFMRDKNWIQDCFEKDANRYREIIYSTSKSFLHAFDTGLHSLAKNFTEDVARDLSGFSGTVLLTESMSLSFVFDNMGGNHPMSYRILLMNNELLMAFFEATPLGTKTQVRCYCVDKEEATRKHLSRLVMLAAFIRFAEVETKVINNNEKFNDLTCKYINTSAFPITILDSTWFRTIINTSDFKVRGHFRWQACGIGLKKRKLIFVDEFLKHGYVREAGVTKRFQS